MLYLLYASVDYHAQWHPEIIVYDPGISKFSAFWSSGRPLKNVTFIPLFPINRFHCFLKFFLKVPVNSGDIPCSLKLIQKNQLFPWNKWLFSFVTQTPGLGYCANQIQQYCEWPYSCPLLWINQVLGAPLSHQLESSVLHFRVLVLCTY